MVFGLEWGVPNRERDRPEGSEFGLQYFAGYVIEKSLAVDNVFTFIISNTGDFYDIDRAVERIRSRLLHRGLD